MNYKYLIILNNRLEIKSYLWKKESDTLFDYDSKELKTLNLSTDKDAFLIKKEARNRLKLVPNRTVTKENHQYLCQIIAKDSIYFV